MTNLANIKRLYLWKPSICKTFWTTLVLSTKSWQKWHQHEMYIYNYQLTT